jgi:hypothetical protein
MNAVGCFIIGMALLAVGWHAVAEHHSHLRIVKIFRPDIEIPQSTHDAWWHSLSRWRRFMIQGTLLVVAVVVGTAYRHAPTIVAAIGGGAVVAALVVLAIRLRPKRQP